MNARPMVSLLFVFLFALTASGGEARKERQSIQGKVKWSFDAGYTVAGQFVTTEKACIFSVWGKHGGIAPADRQGRIVALDKDNGNLKWEFKIDGQFPGQCVIWKDLVLCGSDNGTLFAVELNSGKERWKRKFTGRADTTHGIAVIADKVAISPSSEGGPVHLIDAATGNPVWKKNGAFCSIGADASHLYLGTTESDTAPAGIAKVDPADGKEIWTFSFTQGFLQFSARPVFDADNVYIATYSPQRFNPVQNLYALRKKDGKLLWKNALRGNQFGIGLRKGPYIYQSQIYLTDSVGGIWINAADGAVVAQTKFQDDSLPLAEGVVLNGITAQEFKSQKKVWSAAPLPKGKPLNNTGYARPILNEGRIYTDLPSGHVICIE